MPELPGGLANAVSWPFSWRPSLENLADPGAQALLGMALLQLGLAAGLLTLAMARRRGVVPAGLVALVVCVLQVPSLGVLLVAAYPTSLWSSQTGFTAASIVEGRAVFRETCAGCHGAAADGAGAKSRAADLRQRHVWDHPPGDLFWFVSRGIPGLDGGLAMPGFEAVLSPRARWAAIDYILALNAGGAVHGLGGWPHRVLAPDLPLSCAAGGARSIVQLRGKAVHVVLGESARAPPRAPAVGGVETVTVALGRGPEADGPGIDCWGQEGADAYAILAGERDGRPIQARFLIDPAGVLRSIRRGDEGAGWDDPVRLLEDLRTICTETLTLEPGDDHEHRR